MRLIPIKSVITDKISGEWGKEAVDGSNTSVAIIRTANFFNTGKINFEKIVRREVEQSKVAKKKLINGDVIIEKSGGSPTQPVGRVVLFENRDGDTYLCNNFTTILRPNWNIIDPEYFFYALFDNYLKGKTQRYQNKTTGIINLKLDKYLDSEIPVPEGINDQKRIAHLLGKVEGMIDQRKQQLQQLDDLLKSVFLEMFGDPVKNEKGWGTVSFDKIGKFTSGGTPSKKRDDFWNGSFPWVSPKDMKTELIVDSIDHISESVFKETNLKKMSPNHLLIVVRGMILAHSFPVAINSIDVAINQDMKAIKPIDGIEVEFLKNCLKALKRQILILISTAGHGTKKFDSVAMRKLFIPIPPKSSQKEFTLIAKRIEELEFKYQQSLNDLEQLYGALSQKAFKGELDLSRITLDDSNELLDETSKKLEFTPEQQETTLAVESDEAVLTINDRTEFLRDKLQQAIKESVGEMSAQSLLESLNLSDYEYKGEPAFETLQDYELLKNMLFESIETSGVQQIYEEADDTSDQHDGKRVILTH